MTNRQLVLASASPRRRALLESAGFAPAVLESDLDDARLERGAVDAVRFVAALSWFKARRVAERNDLGDRVLLAADTECLDGDRLLGKPADEDEARTMLRGLRERRHRTVTAVSLIEAGGRRHLFADLAFVTIGALADEEIDRYVAEGGWRGKAGGYNFAERLAAGWPIACEGDPTSVMGLPMRRLVPMLESLGVSRC